MDDKRIKSGHDFYLYYFAIPALLIFLAIHAYSDYRQFPELNLDVIDLMISVVTFIFGFLISISFSMVMNRIAALKESLAGETGRLVSLYLLAENLGSKFKEKIGERIDRYTVNTLRDYSNYNVGREAVYGMYDDLQYIELKDKRQEMSASSFTYILGEFEPLREKLEYLTSNRSKILLALKFANYILALLLVVLLYLNRGSVFADAMFIIMSSIIVFIILILEDYDLLKIGDYSANISNSEQIFDLIGRERYYPQSLLSKVKLEGGRSYRIGVYDRKTKEEKVVSIRYYPGLKLNLKNLIKFRSKK